MIGQRRRDFTLAEDEAAYDMKARVFMSVGALEMSSMRAGMEQLASTLGKRGYPSLQISTRVFEHETHAMALAGSLAHGFRALLCEDQREAHC